MKSTAKPKVKRKKEDELRSHYDIDYSAVRPNRFARLKKAQMVVLPDSDLSKVFKTPEEVTHALRSLIDAIPHKRGSGKR